MHFTIESSDLNQATIHAIQQRFGDATLVINVEQGKHRNGEIINLHSQIISDGGNGLYSLV